MKLVPQRVFLLAIGLMVGGGILGGFTMYRLFTSERMVRHTYRVRLELSQIEASLSRAGRTRVLFLNTADTRYQREFDDTRKLLQDKLVALHSLISDNAEQRAHADELDRQINQRLDIIQLSIRHDGPMGSDEQLAMTQALASSAYNPAQIIERMDTIEEGLLSTRSSLTSAIFAAILLIWLAAFVVAFFLFRVYYHLLTAQLKERELAEQNARNLSTELMHVQDEERRKLAVDLHDGVGQMITAAKMTAGRLAKTLPPDSRFSELEAMLEDGLQQTRTLSHLLHPPMLEEIGLMAAARWFVENYRQRTGVNATFDGPESVPPLAKGLELALLRVMQEALTNIHKHSRATAATVHVTMTDHSISLQVKDNGGGIPAEKLQRFREDGTGMGIGIVGMKQRVREQGGTFSLDASSSGTTISVAFPLASYHPQDGYGTGQVGPGSQARSKRIN